MMLLYSEKHDEAMIEEDWVECIAAGSFKGLDIKDLIAVTYNPMTGEYEPVE